MSCLFHLRSCLLCCGRKGGKTKKKGSPYASVGGGKHALSAVVLHPVKACVALCIITSSYIINSLPPSLISIIIKLLLCLVYNNTAPTIVLAAPSFFRSSSSSIIVLLYYYVVEIFFPILCCCLLFSSAFFFCVVVFVYFFGMIPTLVITLFRGFPHPADTIFDLTQLLISTKVTFCFCISVESTPISESADFFTK